MCKFKVGDKVVRKSNLGLPFNEGQVYEVSHVDYDGWIKISEHMDCGTFNFRFFELAPDTSKRRPHYDLIIAWANGAEIEAYDIINREWYVTKTPLWGESTRYRIKPDPKDEALEAAKKAFEQAEEAYKKAAEALAKAGG